MTSERFSESLMSRATDRKRGTTPEERQWREGYVDGASSILSELDVLIEKEKGGVPTSLVKYVNQFKKEQ